MACAFWLKNARLAARPRGDGDGNSDTNSRDGDRGADEVRAMHSDEYEESRVWGGCQCTGREELGRAMLVRPE